MRPDSLVLDGRPLDFATLARVGAGGVRVVPTAEARARVRAGRQAVEDAVADRRPVYGTNTGVGAMKDVSWSQDELDAFNAGLVRAHHFGTGTPFPASTIRNAMLIRVNTALSGRVGCSEDLVDAFLALLDRNVVPVVRRTGSIGCGDIGLMGQIGATLTGVGEAFVGDRRLPAAIALEAAGLAPIELKPRDALASFAVNAIGFAAAAESTRAAAHVLRILLATGLATASALGAARNPWRAASAIGSAPEKAVADWLVAHSSEAWPVATHVQDPLSLRMSAQVYGMLLHAIGAAGDTVLANTGRPDDNPVVIDGEVLTSGASLPLDVALFMQMLQVALCHMARNSFNRCVLLGNGVRRGLPVNLVPPGAIATGFGPVIKLAGELFTRVLSMATPVSAQALVVASGIEDEAAFLPLVNERVERQVRALHRLAALEGLLAAQAMDIAGDRPTGIVGLVHGTVREHAGFYDTDRPLSAEVEAIEGALASRDFLHAVIERAPLPALDTPFALSAT